MRLIARTAGFAVAIAVAVQTLASGGGAVLVCRYTGRVLDPCACPHDSRKGDPAPSLQAQSCCELREAPPSLPAIAKTSAPSLTRLAPMLLAPPRPASLASAPPSRLLASLQPQAPPDTPLYLTVRALLI